ncbi:DUF6233 domain-containing protein [Streptomyces sp. R21]|uniref:DUF6233 domain-containing protein n=1 Tax=Streptomyces sp. R21 TaxID=3238627 RepID=A0AB39PLX2_9ACTN
MRVWHSLWLRRIDTKIAAVQQRGAEQKRGERNRPPTPDGIVELGIGNGRPDTEVHVDGCYAAGTRQRAVSRHEAQRLLAVGLRACSHCHPDTELGILDCPLAHSASSAELRRKVTGLLEAPQLTPA